ncbi:hypothetical protein LEP1GSC058_0630 [Leptospira fainei serovar Hurstbridge str. BUT 6]|uniref:Lipoprotein n=1 Tax=Leptospira fainei serovar Hurstbridge str. BUT 6 TaxID=1193011 RepID=S3W7M9_9LEPT|nr:hypothetical protein [Leptospira fainei]EPG76087.1 hypothetical protein LEP1GSC058_0630 [Leptospira fainei serovar Hurstbridge str. BUT 6]
MKKCFRVLLFLIIFSSSQNVSFAVPLDPDQKVFQPGEIFRENFLTISFPEKALVRTESRKRWRAIPLKDRPWILVWRKLDRVGEADVAKDSVRAVFPGKEPETFSSSGAEILRWTKEDLSGGNPLRLYFFLIRKGELAYTVYVAFYRERKDLEDWFSIPSRYLETKNQNPI